MNFQSLPIPFPQLRHHNVDADVFTASKASGRERHCRCPNPNPIPSAPARNLVVSLDGVSVSKHQNSTVLELHTHILLELGDNQRAYYASAAGIGGVLGNFLSERTSKTTIMKAYRWLCEEYQAGDRIFLFGFSRGAYNVHTLAAMIDMVGLVGTGNRGFMTTAYKLFSRAQNGKGDTRRAAAKFKSTFCRKVNVHFIGVWDTDARNSPLISQVASRVCMYRQALALDEVAAYCSAVGVSTPSTSETRTTSDSASVETKIGSVSGERMRSPRRIASSLASTQVSKMGRGTRDVKEVWFPGTRSEMGSGLRPDAAFNLSSVPLSWMENEAVGAGLRLRSRLRSKSKWDALQEGKHPLSALKRMLESKPLKTRKSPRKIESNQRLHGSIAFQSTDYRPRATFTDPVTAVDWLQLVGQSSSPTFQWAFTFGDQLDVSFFDRDTMLDAIRNFTDVWRQAGQANTDREAYWVQRLAFMALSGKLCRFYLDAAPEAETRIDAAVSFFRRLAELQPAVFTGDLASALEAKTRHLHATGVNVEWQLDEVLRLRRVDAALPLNRALRASKLAATLVCNAAYAASVAQNPPQALFLFDEALEVLRPLLVAEEESDYALAFPLLEELRRHLGECLSRLSRDSSARRVCESVVALAREVTEIHPEGSSILAAALRDLAFGFPEPQAQSAVAEEALNLYRSLAEEDPTLYDKTLADLLYNYSLHLLRHGQQGTASRLSFEELELRRKLKEAAPLAACLEQLARSLLALGESTAGIEHAQEAVSLRRRVLEEKQIDHWEAEAGLVDALHVLSCAFSSATGRMHDAMDSARQAVSAQRAIAKDPGRLAILLTNLSVALSEEGRHADALRGAEEVVKIRAMGTGDDGECAVSLSRLAICLRGVGRQSDAIVVADKCLQLVRSVEETDATVAETMHALSICLSDEPDNANIGVQVAAESVTRYRQLYTRCNSAGILNAFIKALLQWSLLLVLNDQQDDAVRIAVEAAQLGGSSVSKDLYAQTLYHLSTGLYAVGKENQAAAPAQRAVDVLRTLVASSSSWRLKEQLADALFNASLYPAHPPSLKALEALREAVSLQRELKPYISAQRFDARMVDGLQNLAARALIAGEYAEALMVVEEAALLARILAQHDASAFTSGLVNVLYTQASVLCEHERFEEAYTLVVECDSIGQDAGSDSLFTSFEATAAYISTRARCLLGLGRRPEGVRGLLEGMRLYRCALESPLYRSMFESFPWFLNNCFACISALGRSKVEGLSATVELVELARLLTEFCPAAGGADHYLRLVLEYHPFNAYNLTSPDGSITATFVPFGSTLTELWVHNKHGELIDVVPGYDDNSRLLTDGGHPVLMSSSLARSTQRLTAQHGPIVGRYANRIKNCTFSIPISKNPQPDGPGVYHTPCNDHNGQDTLHGGIYGWDRRNWTVVEASKTSVVFKHVDNADEGFPGVVTAIVRYIVQRLAVVVEEIQATHTVSNGGILRSSVQATAKEKTPIMTTQHIYWNLCGFRPGCDNITSHILTLPASRIIEVDGNGIPTGKLVNVSNTRFDFRKERAIRDESYDNAWIYDRETGAEMSLYSATSGIKLKIRTDQPVVQVYTASLNVPRKQVHGEGQYGHASTVAIEQEGWLDAINTPEWTWVDQIYDAKREFTWNTEYQFVVERE
ncbi:DUF2235 domain-containing protein [Mycena kentingensis (nom. inval.)]|nr:DUF2235 domain-containing protein [Mycena kentingensis (nom. inval.)]